MDSGVIFLIVVGIWAAFLLPDLQLRRHRLSQSRAAETMSESARILARDNGSAQASPAEGPTHDVLTASGTAQPPTDGDGRQSQEQATGSSRASGKQGVLSSAVHALLAAVAVLAVLAVLAVPVTAGLAAFSVLSWRPVVVASGLTLAVLAGLRLRARYVGRKGRRRQVRFPRAAHSRVAERPASAEVKPANTPAAATDQGAATASGAGAPSTSPTRTARRGEVAFDRAAFEPSTSEGAPQPRPGEWTPRPVPTPSYLRQPSLPAPSERGQLMDARPTTDPFADLLDGGGLDSGGDQVDGDAAQVV